MEENKIIVTVVDGIGVVEAKNDLAHFTLSIKAKSETLDNAKSQVEERTNQFLKALSSLKDKGMKLDTEVITTLTNYKLEHRESGERTDVGYQSANTINFVTLVDSNLDEIYKICLKFDFHMSRPYFSIKNREVLSEQAMIKATDNAKDKFNKECSLLNVSPDKLKIQNWNFGYEGQFNDANSKNLNTYNSGLYGAQGATGPTGPQGSIGSYGPMGISTKIGTTYQELLDQKLEPGKITARVVVRVNYVWSN